MKLHSDMKWVLRMAAILVGVGLIDALVVLFAAHPLPWAVTVPALIPLFTATFVLVPWISETRQ